MQKNDEKSAEYFMLCLDLLYTNELNRKAIITALAAHEALHIIYQKQNDTKLCLEHLDTALKLYIEYTKMEDYPEPFDIVSNLLENEERSQNPLIILHKLHLTNIEHLINMYFLDDRGMHTFVIYIHNLLKIEMNYRETFSFENYVDWILVTFHLSYYFIYHKRFAEAKNHITTAFYILEKFRNTYFPEHSTIEECYEQLAASGKRAWVNYGLELLRLSNEKLRQNKLGGETNEPSETAPKPEAEQTTLIFSALKKDPERVIIHITDKYVTNYSEVNTIFKSLKKWFEELLKYFEEKNDLANEAVTTIGFSKAYKYLSLFEQNRDKVNKIYKTRVDLLERMNNKLDKKSLPTKHLYQRICLELGIVNTLRLNINDEEIRITNKVIMKEFEDDMKEIATASMNHYIAYMKSLTEEDFE